MLEGRCVSVAPPCRTTATSSPSSQSRRTLSGSRATTRGQHDGSTMATGCAANCKRWCRRDWHARIGHRATPVQHLTSLVTTRKCDPNTARWKPRGKAAWWRLRDCPTCT
ncbi:hypothetical protein MSG28_009124 [Choristoneura fumiferana]|uniref:Uncharacterized protein n=1 Tax=Choristoneura fumiferana TaxID=7141 RepID=A0ACC0KWV6_CHOFU|nr:hypothetical protein MSG28_009124 [Choristoneura fumiferana]